MKKFIITLLMLMLCVSTALFTISCDKVTKPSTNKGESSLDTESVIESESTAESETESEIVDDQSFIEFKTLTIDGLTAYGKVSNATVDFSFIEEINVVGGADFIVALDSYGTQTVITKKVPLAEGDNTFYVFETTGGKLVKTYVVTVRRRPLYRVTFNTNGGSAVVTQYVEEDFLATEPTTEKAGYDFVSWNYNFNEPITRDTVVTVQFEIKPEMSNFNFTSTATTCLITGLKDKTVTESIIPDYVTSIGEGAFFNCDSLTSVVIGNGVTSIGFHAFEYCDSLTSVVIPDSVTSIGDRAFYNCHKLVEVINKSTHFTVTKGSTDYGYLGYYALAVYNSGDAYISKLSNDGDYIIYTDGAEKISVGYKGAETDLVLPSYITKIYQYAFYYCNSLTSVVIGDGVTSIGDSAFYGCSSLTSVVIGDGVTSIGDSAFEYCRSLTSVVIGDSVTSIGFHAFESCRSLTSVVIGDSVTSIGKYAFGACYKLVEVVNKSTHFTVTKGSAEFGYLGYYALAVYNSGDAYISKLSNDGDYIIYTDGAEKILVGYNGAETDLVLPSYITEINRFAFYACTSLTSVVIGDSVTSIGDRAFVSCDSLTSVVIPDSVTSIGYDAFSSCYKLVEVVNKSTHFTVTKGSAEFGYLGYYALAVYNSGDAYISKLSNDGDYIIYTDGAEKILVDYKGAETDLVLPSYITKINQYAFFYCDSLTSVVIGDGVTSIGKHAFALCGSLTSVVIGNGVTSIGSLAFYDCTSLTSVYYKGTASEWSGISIDSSNLALTNATRYYYSETQPTASGNYWHYDEDGNVAVW